MNGTPLPERWLRGPLPGIPAVLQPAAHALLQASDEIALLLVAFDNKLLWQQPAGLASPGFHLQHITGVLDRLFTYAAGKSLSEEQMVYLKKEGQADDGLTKDKLLELLQEKIRSSVDAMSDMAEETLTAKREVGRAKLPSTVLGLVFHAAEHTMRHTGQLLVTVAVLNKGLHRPD
jgi:hypothetical protein